VLIRSFFLSLWCLDWWSLIVRDPWFLRLLLPLLWYCPGLYYRKLICTPPIPFIIRGISFLSAICLSIIWGFLPQYYWKVSCTILMQFVPLLLGEFLLQYYWNVLCAAHTLFVPYHLGNFCFHFILGRLVSCAHHSLATFLLGPPACFFCLKGLSCASLVLPSFGATLSLPVQLGAPFWSIISLYHPYSNLVGIFSTGRLFLCHFILGISSEAPLRWFPSIHTPACWSYHFECVSLICPLALGIFLELLLCYSPPSLL